MPSYLKLHGGVKAPSILVIAEFISDLKNKQIGHFLKASAGLVVAALIAKRLDLYMFNYVFGRALELGVLILLIIFQPEVRAMLEKVGAVTRFIPGSDSSRELGRPV